MPRIEPILRSIGFTESEVKTYLCALTGGPQPASDLSQKTTLSRQAVYSAIDSLTDRGLISSVQRDGRTVFMAESPKALLAYAKRHEDDVRKRLADLEICIPSLELQAGGERPVVKMYEGKEGMRALTQQTDALHEEEMYELTDCYAMFEVLTEEDIAPYREALRKQKHHVSSMISYKFRPSPEGIAAARMYLPESDAGFKSHVQVVGNHVNFITFVGKLHSIMIDSKPVADLMRLLFRYARKGLRTESIPLSSMNKTLKEERES